MISRGAAVAVLVLLLLVLAALAAWRVPWRERSGPREDQLAALASLPSEQVARGAAFHAALRPVRYIAMVVGLAYAMLVGLTPLGADIVTGVGGVFGGGRPARALAGGLLDEAAFRAGTAGLTLRGRLLADAVVRDLIP